LLLNQKWKGSQIRIPAKTAVNLPNNHVYSECTAYEPTFVKNANEHGPLKCLSFNVQGLQHKFLHFTYIIAEKNPNVIAITETWLDNSILDTEFSPDDYNTFRKNRNITYYSPGTYSQDELG
jgi:hypothetical protein